MNSDRYIEVIKKKVIPNLNNAFPGGEGIFQQDLAPCHTSKKCAKFMRKTMSRFYIGLEIPRI